MRIFRISGDSDFIGVRCAKWPDDKMLQRLDTDGEIPQTDFHPLLSFYFVDPVSGGVVTDLPYMNTNSTLVVSSRAAEALEPVLLPSGFFLDPITPEGMSYKIFVCLTQLDALDPDRTVYFPEKEYGEHSIKSFAFKPEVVDGIDIFRVKDLANRLFASERFLHLVAAHRLTGLKVCPV